MFFCLQDYRPGSVITAVISLKGDRVKNLLKRRISIRHLLAITFFSTPLLLTVSGMISGEIRLRYSLNWTELLIPLIAVPLFMVLWPTKQNRPMASKALFAAFVGLAMFFFWHANGLRETLSWSCFGNSSISTAEKVLFVFENWMLTLLWYVMYAMFWRALLERFSKRPTKNHYGAIAK